VPARIVRVTFILPETNFSGGNRVVAIYARLLAARGHQVVVVSQPRRQPTLREKAKSWLSGRGWPPRARESGSHLDASGIDHRVIDRYRPMTDVDLPDADVVVATWWETAEWVLRLSPAKGAKAYFLQHYEMFDWTPHDRVAVTWRSSRMHKIVVADWLAEIARVSYGDEKSSLVPNSVDLEQFKAPARTKQRVPTVGLMYTPTPWKGTDISLRAFALAAQRIPGLQLVAFGEDPPRVDLPVPADTRYTTRPPQDRLWEQYASCDAWLFGSRSEGFGLPLLEAMACRTPVIATPAGAAPELLRQGGGMLVRSESPEEMAQAIERVCGLSAERWRLTSDQAYQTAAAYTWQDAVVRMEAALTLAIDRSRAGELAQ
jgi:glycosyltransferase involved in cell wall biosynthesis